MKVTVKPYLFLRRALGFKEIVLPLPAGSTIKDLLQLLRQEYGLPASLEYGRSRLVLFTGERPSGISILLDGRNIRHLQDELTPLYDGAVVTLFPPAAGG